MEVHDEVWYAIDSHFGNLLLSKIKIQIQLIQIDFFNLVKFLNLPKCLLTIGNEYDRGLVNVMPLEVDAHFHGALAFPASFNCFGNYHSIFKPVGLIKYGVPQVDFSVYILELDFAFIIFTFVILKFNFKWFLTVLGTEECLILHIPIIIQQFLLSFAINLEIMDAALFVFVFVQN